jgi:transposase
MADSCPDCRRLHQRVAELEAKIEHLTRLLEAQQRAGKRQAAPFAKGPPKATPQTPGRKAGDAHGTHGHRPPPPPDQIDETLPVALPPACPHCGQNDLEATDVVEQFQTEIPRRPWRRCFRIQRGRCRQCRRPVQGRHPLQTSDALGAAASQIGPDAQAAIVHLNKHGGLSYGKIAHLFATLWGLTISRGACAQIVLRAADRLGPVYAEIRTHLKASPVIVPDETGWRIGGWPAWLHGWVGDDVTCYVIDSGRGAGPLQEAIGGDWSGTLVHDGWSPYDQFVSALHQQCQAHALRRARELEAAATGAAKVFPRQVITLLQESLACRDTLAAQVPEPTAAEREAAQAEFAERLLAMTREHQPEPSHERFAKHLYHHGERWFAFLADAAVPATNYQAEQAMRPAVVNRKVWGGNRTEAGAEAQAVTLSVLQTCQQQAVAFVDYVSQTLRGVAGSLFASAAAAER